jgi:cytochrome c-type biogenesis protein CcmH
LGGEFGRMTLWFAFALMTAAAIFAVLWPLARRPGKFRSGSDVLVYRDQLDEIARDRAAGLIEDKEAAAAEAEVSRRLIAAADAQDTPGVSTPSPLSHRRVVAALALVMLPLGAAGLYLVLGSPSLPDQPLGLRVAAAHGADQSIASLIARVEKHLQSNPEDARGWEVIAPIYIRLGRFDEAVKARRQVLRLSGESADRATGLGEALVFAANGMVTDEAKTAFERAVGLDAGNVQARYFLGLAAEQDGDRSRAAALWRALIESAPPDAPWIDFVRRALARVGGSPLPGGLSEQEVAAASDTSTDQRNTMIRGMVARLAERLAQDGSDIEGWMRLLRSYVVLGEAEKARATVLDARRALASEPGKLRQLDDFVKGLGLDG